MVVDSTLDAYTITLGFYIYSLFWDLFVSTGLIYFALLKLIVSNVVDAQQSSMEDFNTNSSAKKIGVGLLLMILALQIGLYPMVSLNFNEIRYYSRSCHSEDATNGRLTSEIAGEEAEFVAQNMRAHLNGNAVKTPVLLYLAFSLGQAIKNKMVSDLPCSTDIRFISEATMSQKIEDELLRQETQEFIRWCYQPAKRKWDANWNIALDAFDNWPGGRKLVLDRGFYDNADGDGFYSKKARPGFSGTLNQLPESASLSSGYGFPTCKEWWLGVGRVNTPYISPEALSTRLFDSLDEWLKDNSAEVYETVTDRLNVFESRQYMYIGEKDAVVYQSLFTPIKLSDLDSITTTDYGTQGDTNFFDYAFRFAGTVGLYANAIPQFSGASMIQLSMPMVKSTLIMVLIICYLPAMLIAGFKWKYIGLFCGVFISMQFWAFWWELSRMLDDTLLTAMDIPLSEVNTNLLTQWIIAALYLFAPLTMTAVFSWVGLAGVEGQFGKMSGSAGSAGQSGGNKAQSVAKDKAQKLRNKVSSKGAANNE